VGRRFDRDRGPRHHVERLEGRAARGRPDRSPRRRGDGVFGWSKSAAETAPAIPLLVGVFGYSAGQGVRGTSTAGDGVVGLSTSGRGVHGDSAAEVGVWGTSGSTVHAGILGQSTNSRTGGLRLQRRPRHRAPAPPETGVYGYAGKDDDAMGVCGTSPTGTGVYGFSPSGTGVWGNSTSSDGVCGNKRLGECRLRRQRHWTRRPR